MTGKNFDMWFVFFNNYQSRKLGRKNVLTKKPVRI